MGNSRSKLVRMFIRNIGCIGDDGIWVDLDDMVCIVGKNNSGKSTVLRAYELAYGSTKFDWALDRCSHASVDQPSEVILDVHIPPNIGNVGEEWKQKREDLSIVSSRWQWKPEGSSGGATKPIRSTRRPDQSLEDNEGYAEDGKAGGADNVFKSSLPQPVRIGSRGDPMEAEKALLKLVLEPVSSALNDKSANQNSELAKAIARLVEQTQTIVSEQKHEFEAAIDQIQDGFASVFGGLTIRLDVSPAAPSFEPERLIKDGSGLRIVDGDMEVQLLQQGAGAQRALFWTILQVHNRLKSDRKTREDRIGKLQKERDKNRSSEDRKAEIDAEINQLRAGGEISRPADDLALPGYILLIDEPENALHPLAARAAQRQLYKLAAESDWQVMMTTHSPLFINPAVDHTTIMRIERDQNGKSMTPRSFRADEAGFSGGDKAILKAVQEMDPTFCEVFFGSYPIIVEGDTEHAAFLAAVVEDDQHLVEQVTIIKARGKAQIRAIMKMLIHFKKDFGVMHDSDWPYRTTGENNQDGSRPKSQSWAHNLEIRNLVHQAWANNIAARHEVCLPDFERHIGLPRADKAKPFSAYNKIKESEDVKQRVVAMFQRLRAGDATETRNVENVESEQFVENLKTDLNKMALNNPDWPDTNRI